MFIEKLVAALVLPVLASGMPTKLEARQGCSALQLVHVSGTAEIGLGIVGTPLSLSLESAMPGTTTENIEYSTIPEYIITVAEGATATQDYLTSQAARCPNQRFVLSGYSKGALVLHDTELSSDLKSKVVSIVVFGDPARNIDSPWPINSPSVNLTPRDSNSSAQNVASFCNDLDLFCDLPGVSLPAHLAYPLDGSIDDAANFIKSKMQS